MMFLRYLFVSALFWLIFVAGYLCRGVLGDWLLEAHTGTVASQVAAVSEGLFRVFLTFVLFAVVVSVCVGVAFGAVGVLQELWWQVFKRRVVALLTRRRERREEELRRAAEEDEGDIGAPRESVSARRHARRGRDGTHNPPKPTGSLMGRLKELEAQAETEEVAPTMDDDDIEVVYL